MGIEFVALVGAFHQHRRVLTLGPRPAQVDRMGLPFHLYQNEWSLGHRPLLIDDLEFFFVDLNGLVFQHGHLGVVDTFAATQQDGYTDGTETNRPTGFQEACAGNGRILFHWLRKEEVGLEGFQKGNQLAALVGIEFSEFIAAALGLTTVQLDGFFDRAGASVVQQEYLSPLRIFR